MGYLIDFITIFLGTAGFAFLNAFAIGGGLYIMYKKMGPPDDSGAFDFTTSDKRATNTFLIKTYLHGAVGATAVMLIGYLLHRISNYLHSAAGGGWWSLFFLLLIFQLAGTFLAAQPLQKIDRNRALLLLPCTFLTFIIYYPWVFADLLK